MANMTNTDDKFANWVKDFRERLGLDQRDFAKLLQTPDYPVSHGTVGTWERAEFRPKPDGLSRLAELSGEAVWRLAQWAYGWPMPDDVPPEVDERKQEALIELNKLAAQNPEQLPYAARMLRDYLEMHPLSTPPEKARRRKRRPKSE